MLCAKGHFWCALCSHCGPMMISIKGLQCMQKATCISYLISALMAGIWWPISMACIICEEPNLTLCIAYDDLYQGSVICAKGHLLLACSLHSMQAYDNLYKGSEMHAKGYLYTLSALIAGLWSHTLEGCNTCKGPFLAHSLHWLLGFCGQYSNVYNVRKSLHLA